ncbi:MAG TPA: DUF433 domain-containing protein [Thermoanaerobaculia bacterium]|nr:DUF433 domain-containing protein [Thermoanaerobaculia bacterium]
MSLPFAIEPPPLTTDTDGVVRVGGTRVTLETLVEAFHEGLTAEEIAQQYPTLALADIYAVIGYYLRRRSDVQEYLEESRRQAAEVRNRNQTRTDPRGIRERLLARRHP